MQKLQEKKQIAKEIVKYLFQNGLMPDRELMNKIENSDVSKINAALHHPEFVFTKDNLQLILDDESMRQAQQTSIEETKQEISNKEINLPNPSNLTESLEKNISNEPMANTVETTSENADDSDLNDNHTYQSKVFSNIKITYTYNDAMKKKNVQSFVKYFNARYKTIRNMLMQRTELSSVQSIRRILEKKEKETISTIGIIYDKRETKNGNLVIEIEDQTGTINVIINKDKKEVFELAKNTVLDEVIGVTGSNGDKAIFANSIVIPDTPVGREFKKAEDEAYAVVLSDLHVGSTLFLEEEFDKFTNWLSGNVGNERQKNLAKNVKYIFIAGDLVDGVGIYPSQQKELNIDDIYGQYDKCAELLNNIPKHIPIMIIPGNHDAMRLTEPQPVLYKDYAKALWALPNVMMLTNPAYVNIHASENFPGFDVLLYHGYSFTYYADTIESIRQKRPTISERSDLVQKFLLQRRHLSPSHTATLYVQDEEKDPLIIDKVPDFFISGHIHRASVSNYRNVTMISGSCFQEKTPFEEKLGLNPDPGKIPLINLQTREVKILNFSIEKDESGTESKGTESTGGSSK